VPVDYTTDTQTLEDIDYNIKQYAADLSCTDDSQCETTEYGYRACGGASEHLLYSKLTIREQALLDQISDYDRMFQDYTAFYSLSSDCLFVQEPTFVGCESGQCVAR